LERQKSFQEVKPTLYLVPTPIGNLEDMTIRGIRILKEVDKIFAEDTRVTQKLLDHYDIHTSCLSYHEHNKASMKSEMLDFLDEKKNIALVSDAGTPVISDPGREIVEAARKAGYHVVSLPGPSAFVTALVATAFPAIPFTFYGFLDAKQSRRLTELENLRYRKETLVFYEAPHRLKELLEDMYVVLGNRRMTIARELTKTFEELISGSIAECMTLDALKGEMVVIVEGYDEEIQLPEGDIVAQIDFFIEEGMKRSDAMKKLSEMTGIPKNKIYQEYLEKKDH